MAYFWQHQSETTLKIPNTIENSGVIFYSIHVSVGPYTWKVLHRYSEFYELHNQLVLNHGVSKDSLPSKKVIFSKNPEFIETRRQGLETYIQKTLIFLKRTMPRIFIEFLDFEVYDIYFLLQSLTSKVLQSENLKGFNDYNFSPLTVHAISKCCKNPFSTDIWIDSKCDFSHVLDMCSQIQELNITGLESPFGASNIVPNELEFDFVAFKAVSKLVLNNVNLDQIENFGNLRSTLQNLEVHKTCMSSVSQILQCDVLHKKLINPSQMYEHLEYMDLSNNQLINIDKSISLISKLQVLILNENKLIEVPDLSCLLNLITLSLSNNLIQHCSDLHLKLGNLKYLNLNQNFIARLHGFAKLYSLENLDLSNNNISEVDDIQYLKDLPCLENIILRGNNVTTVVDYRVKVFEHFGPRAKEISLDDEKPLQPELDKVNILRALRIVKEGKTPDIMSNFQ